ncbi:glycosyltransferase family 4 protein [Thiosocius teredinicola]|uniref:glycosyltransferase family 4 protein n=1 Tax=Thiosocius teredinicola TaxID=1973002 RepID=UPI0013DDD165
MVGTLPPLRAISSYCEGVALALAEHTEVEFFSFSALYPKALYPGAIQVDDQSEPPRHPNLLIHRRLAWYNPLSWVSAGLRAKGDVLNLQWWSLPLAPILIVIALTAKARGVPVVVTVHNVTPHNGNRVLHRIASSILYALANAILLHSRRNEEVFHQVFPAFEDRTAVFPMGAADFKHDRVVDKRASRQHLGIAQHKRVLLLFGAVREYKGWDTALKAVDTLRNNEPNTLLIIAGQAWDSADAINNTVRTLKLEPNVRLDLAFVQETDIHHYLSAADVLLMPYKHFDAQSGVGTSALTYGLPVVVSDCGGLQDLVIDDESVVPRDNALRLAERLREILSNADLYATLCSHSEFLAQRFSWASISQKICAFFQTTIEPQR